MSDDTGRTPGPIILERPVFTGPMVAGPHGEEAVRVFPSGSARTGDPGVMLEATPIRLVADEPIRLAVALIDAWADANREEPAVVAVSREDLAAILRGCSFTSVGAAYDRLAAAAGVTP